MQITNFGFHLCRLNSYYWHIIVIHSNGYYIVAEFYQYNGHTYVLLHRNVGNTIPVQRANFYQDS